MLFASIILIVLGAIVFIHYIQGLFSATISAILAVIAAVFAFSYHESLVPLFGGKAADYSSGMCLLVLFGLLYILPRLAFDAAIPGNLRLPNAVDKAGAAVMGLIAGIFATGIMAIAASEMPFTANIAGFTRFETTPERAVKVETIGKAFYTKSFDELTVNAPGTPGEEPQGVKIIPVDNIVIGLVNRLSSETGSLQNNKPLATIHPDFLTEAFAQRLGIEANATHTAVNLPGVQQVKLDGLFYIDPKIPQADGEADIRSGGPFKPIGLNPSEVFVAARIIFSPAAADSDQLVRFSPGSVRLMFHDPNASGDDQYKNYFPIGSMEGTGKLFLNKLDDFLFCKSGNGADMVFKLPKKVFDKDQATDGSFLEVKRGARFDLVGMKVAPSLTPSPDVIVMRQTIVLNPTQGGNAAPAPAPAPPRNSTPATPPTSTGGGGGGGAASANGFQVNDIKPSGVIPVSVSLAPGADANALLQVPGGGTAKLENSKIKNINMDASRLELNAGNKISEFAVPSGQVMVQVNGVPGPPASAAWAFNTDPEQYELVDSTGKHYSPNGVVAVYRATTGERVRIRYFDATTISGTAAPDGADAPTQVNMLFNVPANTTITEFHDHGQKAKTVNVVAK